MDHSPAGQPADIELNLNGMFAFLGRIGDDNLELIFLKTIGANLNCVGPWLQVIE